MGSLNGNFDRKFHENLDWKFNKNFDGKGGIWRWEMKPRRWQGEKGGGTRNGEKGYKKGNIIFVSSRAMLDTPASCFYKPHFHLALLYMSAFTTTWSDICT